MKTAEPLEITIFSELYVAGQKPEVGADKEFYTLLVQHPDLFNKVVAQVCEETKTFKGPRPTFKVKLNRRRVLYSFLLDAGYIAGDNFPYAKDRDTPFGILEIGPQKSTIELFRFWRNESATDIYQRIHGFGYECIDIAELLALKAQAPDAFAPGIGILELQQNHRGHAVGIDEKGASCLVSMIGSLSRKWRVAARKKED